jgi:hypothetical protein
MWGVGSWRFEDSSLKPGGMIPETGNRDLGTFARTAEAGVGFLSHRARMEKPHELPWSPRGAGWVVLAS